MPTVASHHDADRRVARRRQEGAEKRDLGVRRGRTSPTGTAGARARVDRHAASRSRVKPPPRARPRVEQKSSYTASSDPSRLKPSQFAPRHPWVGAVPSSVPLYLTTCGRIRSASRISDRARARASQSIISRVGSPRRGGAPAEGLHAAPSRPGRAAVSLAGRGARSAPGWHERRGGPRASRRRPGVFAAYRAAAARGVKIMLRGGARARTARISRRRLRVHVESSQSRLARAHVETSAVNERRSSSGRRPARRTACSRRQRRGACPAASSRGSTYGRGAPRRPDPAAARPPSWARRPRVGSPMARAHARLEAARAPGGEGPRG